MDGNIRIFLPKGGLSMEITPTIQTEMENYLKQKGLSKTDFGHITGLNPGTLSGIVTGNRSISVHQLDSITEGMNLPPDYFYERYIDECIIDSPLNWRRISPFLYRCVELDRLDCLQRVVFQLLDHPIYPPLLFKVAEDIYREGHNKAAAFLYENVAESERQQHSVRLAICQYRMFTIQVGEDQNRNLKAATQFEPFVDRLDETDQLDALKDLANVYRSLRQWDKVEETTLKLAHRAKIQYRINRQNTEKLKYPNRPLFFYIAYSNLLMAGVFEARRDYDKALQYTYAYTDLSWVRENDEQTLHWINLFKEWAVANTYANKLLSGDFNILPGYLAYIQNNQDEILPALVNIMEAANCFDFDVDYILEKFETEINKFVTMRVMGAYTENIIVEYLIYLSYGIANYYFNRKIYSKGFEFLVVCLDKSVSTSNKTYIIMCVGLFETFRDQASSELKVRYKEIIKGVHENEKSNRSVLSGG
jgi:transcriptional regulator with XRE-family HTH domain